MNTGSSYTVRLNIDQSVLEVSKCDADGVEDHFFSLAKGHLRDWLFAKFGNENLDLLDALAFSVLKKNREFYTAILHI